MTTPTQLRFLLIATLVFWNASTLCGQHHGDRTGQWASPKYRYHPGHTGLRGSDRSGLTKPNRAPLRGPVRLAFSKGAWMPQPRSHGDAVLVGRRIYYIGGTSSENRRATSILVYDTAENAWSKSSARGFTGRTDLGAAVLRGTIYAAGGYSNVPDVDTFEAYDLATRSWKQLRAMPNRCNSLRGSVVSHRGKIYVVGGNLYGQDRDTIQVFDPTAVVQSDFGAAGPGACQGTQNEALLVHENGVVSELGPAQEYSDTTGATTPARRAANGTE